MLDVDAWECISGILSTIDSTKRPNATDGDCFGKIHILLFGHATYVLTHPPVHDHTFHPHTSCYVPQVTLNRLQMEQRYHMFCAH